MTRFVISQLVLLAQVIALAPDAQAQKFPQRGFLPSAAIDVSNNDDVNLSSGTMTYRVPIYRFPPGHGGSTFDVSLIYSSAIYDPSISTNIQPSTTGGGWNYSFLYKLAVDYAPPSNCTTKSFRLSVIYPDGSRHLLHLKGLTTGALYNLAESGDNQGFYNIDPSNGANNCGGNALTGTLVYYTDDGTYARLELSSSTQAWTLFLPDGAKVSGTGIPGDGNTIADKNGNTVTIAANHNSATTEPFYQITDSLSRSVTVTMGTDPDGTTPADFIKAKGFGGVDLTWTIHWNTYSSTDDVYETTCPPPSTVLCAAGGMNGQYITDIQLPSVGTTILKYQFDYTINPGWGELKSVTTPFGATIAYEYYDGGSPYYRPADDPNVPIKKKTLSWKDPSDVTGTAASAIRTQIWNYSIPFGATNGSTAQGTSSVTKPDGGITSHTFCTSDGSSRKLCKTEEPNGDKVEILWAKNCPFQIWTEQPGNPYVKTRFRTVKSTSGGADQTAITDYSYDRNGNVLSVTEYDWVAASTIRNGGGNLIIPTGATVARTTTNTYSLNISPAIGDSCGASNINGVDDTKAYWFSRSGGISNASNVLRALASSVTTDAFGGKSHVENSYDTTANLTSQMQWRSVDSLGTAKPDTTPLTASNSITTTHTYDVPNKGNLTATTDPKGIKTSYTLSACSGAYASAITEGQFTSFPLSRDTKKTWDCSTGLQTLSTDPNSISRKTDYDVLGRVKQINEANENDLERQTKFAYAVINTSTAGLVRETITSQRDKSAKSDGLITTSQSVNQLGQVIVSLTSGAYQTALPHLSDGTNSYDAISTPYFTSADVTIGWSRRKYDQNGRLIATDHFSGATLPYPWITTNSSPASSSTMIYDANVVTMKDEAGKTKWNTMDALGRLKSVMENPEGTGLSTSPTNYVTSYSYDFANRIKLVSQGVQSRSFTYDSLGNLLSATNPENGTISYLYDANGNVISKKDARNVTTSLFYDVLNRLIVKSYSDGTESVSYCYDGDVTQHIAPDTVRDCSTGSVGTNSINRLTLVKNGVSENIMKYDALGRFTDSTQRTNGISYPFLYSYTNSLLSSPASVQYPTGRQITTTFDNAERVTGIQGGIVTATVNTFAAHGAMSQLTLGNNLVETVTFNSYFQPTQMKIGSLLTLDFGFGATNNGNLKTQTITRGSFVATQSYSYDGVNRLQVASENAANATAPACPDTSAAWCQGFSYDQYGNRKISARTGTTPLDVEPTSFNAATNRNSGPNWPSSNFDVVGNVVADANSIAYGYDAENRQISAGTSTYFYDGDGRRVRRNANGQQITYVYDAFGRLAVEYGSTPLASSPLYLSTDHLGSTRLVTDSAGVTRSCRDFRPFGERIDSVGGQPRSALACYSVDPGVQQQFGGKERDSETTLDYFGARYMSGGQGRFTSVDEPLTYSDATNPQSWNLYSYVNNNPLAFVDGDGHVGYCANGNDNSDSTGKSCNSPSNPLVVLSFYFLTKGPDILDKTKQVLQPMMDAANWLGRTRNPWCMAGAMGAGSMSGGAMGLAGGPGGVVTVPAGFLGGGLAGGTIGLTSCMSSIGQGGDGELVSNPKHHSNSSSPEPKNVEELFAKSIPDQKGVRWAKDTDGTIHRFSSPSNGESHWNGSTGGSKSIRLEDIPMAIRRALK